MPQCPIAGDASDLEQRNKLLVCIFASPDILYRSADIYGDLSFAVYGLCMCNSLPDELRSPHRTACVERLVAIPTI